MFALLFCAVLCMTRISSARSTEPSEDVRHCAYKREEALRLARIYGDVDLDNRLCSAEISLYKANTLYFYERWLLALHPNNNIMDHCDIDQDGYITEEDFANSLDTCLHTCDDITTFFEYFLQRSARNNYVKPGPAAVDCTQN